MNGSYVFSLLLFAAGSFALIFGVHVIQNNPKAHSNRAFLGITVAMQLWAIGLSIATSSPDYYTCVVWRRISALGWGTIFAIMLHFAMILTGKREILKKWWTYVFIYTPAALMVLVFCVPNSINPEPYRLVSTSLGWINFAENNVWDIIYYFYYTGFMVITVVMIFIWGRKSDDIKIKKQFRLLIASFAAAFILGTLTDIVLNFFM